MRCAPPAVAKRLATIGIFGAGALVLCTGCAEDSSPAAPVAPPPAIVRFVAPAQSVQEGETSTVSVSYATNNLTSPLALRIGVGDASAGEDDYTLSAESLEIPPGSGHGALSFEVHAHEDALFAEGDERLLLQLIPASASLARVEGNLEIIIEEAGVRPCRGVRLSGDAPVLSDVWPNFDLQTETATVRLVLEIESEDVLLEWVGPYRGGTAWNPSFRVRNVDPVPGLDQNFVNWSFTPTDRGVRHDIGFEWFAHLTTGFRFRSIAGGCTGEPEALCSRDGCELAP